jgi:hypothetical protein
MMIRTTLGVTAVVAGVAVGLAAPASAEPLSGTYSAVLGNGGTARTWVFTPCGPGCASLEIDPPSTSRELHQQGNTWSGTNDGCTTTVDSVTLAGTMGCGMINLQFQLTRM